ncbi:MAG: SAM-dependent chlorinase/fluorinase [Rubrobacter sp.]|nr:SAM-dependent chlorinase/fluorinase [Rubrobacter sp.]
MRTICFLSDFGLSGDFVGTCRGVIEGIAPGATVLDLTHHVPGFGIPAGAEVLEHATGYMPRGTVYLAVVDPGVGTERRAVALRTAAGSYLVGPDNGLLVPASRALGGVAEAVLLSDGRFHVHPVSTTFHGRDIFAPVAAHLAAGVGLGEVGESLDPGSLVPLSLPGTTRTGLGDLETEIISIDRFGNARLSVTQEEAGLEHGTQIELDPGDGRVRCSYQETFGASGFGALIVVPDSHRRLSISINQGNAARALALSVGDRVRIRPLDECQDDAGA